MSANYTFSYTGGGTAAQKLLTLAAGDGGPIQIVQTSPLIGALGNLGPPGGGNVTIDNHLLEWLVLDDIKFSSALDGDRTLLAKTLEHGRREGGGGAYG